MGILHVAPGASAGFSLRQAVQASGRDEQVIRHMDDLSCGPIGTDDPLAREAWWQQFSDEPAGDDSLASESLSSFWDHIASTDDHLVVWFARRSADEFAFYQAWADRVGERAYDVVDVTDLELPRSLPDGSTGLYSPVQAASLIIPSNLRSLLDHRRPVTAAEHEAARQNWRVLKQENAPFRVIGASGLMSAPIDHFDDMLLRQATPEWHRIAWVVGCTMGNNSEPYRQVGDLMLLTRVVALVEAGKLVTDGDPWDMRACRVRLPD